MNSSINITRGVKRYELTNHLGNINVVLTDKRVPVCNADTVTYYTADVVSANDYSPFGAPLAGRTWYSYTISQYRFHFNGQEKDDQVSGTGNILSATFWEYDSRLGRRWNLDPKPTIGISDYACFANSPIYFKDVNGDTIRISLFGPNESKNVRLKASGDYKNRVNDGVFIFAGHGSEFGIQIGFPRVTKKDGKKTGQGKGKNNQYFEADIPDIYAEFAAACPEFKEAIEKGKKITLILKSCNTGNKDNIVDEVIAQKIANFNGNVTVKAPNGFVSVWDDFIRKEGETERKVGTGEYNTFRKDPPK